MTRAAPLLAAVVLTAYAAAQPPPIPPTWTAFPEIKVPPRSGEPGGKWVPADLHARLRAAADAPLGPDATPAARVRAAQLRAGLDYLVKTYPVL